MQLRMKPSQIARRGWCQHTHARNTAGRACGVNDPDAVQWDTLGALIKSRETGYVSNGAVESVRLMTGYETIQRWNDQPGRTKNDVVRLLQGLGL